MGTRVTKFLSSGVSHASIHTQKPLGQLCHLCSQNMALGQVGGDNP
jgi:hypothetical protein